MMGSDQDLTAKELFGMTAHFMRFEKKYRLSEAEACALESLLNTRIAPDPHGPHAVLNLYYDTDRYDLIRASIEKPAYKEKLRVRSYGVPGQDDLVYVELKKKCGGVVYKRRVPLTLREAGDYLLGKESPRVQSQILREIDWFLGLYRPVPKVFIGYDRTAFFGLEDPELRITFDRGLRYREEDLALSKGDWGWPLMGGQSGAFDSSDSQAVLMEIKFSGAMPLWLSRLLAEMEIYPVSFSKYGYCYQTRLAGRLLFEERLGGLPATAPGTQGGMICA